MQQRKSIEFQVGLQCFYVRRKVLHGGSSSYGFQLLVTIEILSKWSNLVMLGYHCCCPTVAIIERCTTHSQPLENYTLDKSVASSFQNFFILGNHWCAKFVLKLIRKRIWCNHAAAVVPCVMFIVFVLVGWWWYLLNFQNLPWISSEFRSCVTCVTK